MRCRHGFISVFAVMSLTYCNEASAQPINSQSRGDFSVVFNHVPHYLGNGYRGIILGRFFTCDEKLGYGVSIVANTPSQKKADWLPDAWKEGYYLGMIVRQGDLVLVFGAAHRIVGVSDNTVRFHLLTPDEVAAEGVVCDPQSLIFPYQGECRLNESWLYFNEIVGAPPNLRAKIEINPKVRVDGYYRLLESRESVTVGVGDLLKIHGLRKSDPIVAHKVIRIVPPNPTRQVIGWVEVEAEPANNPDEK